MTKNNTIDGYAAIGALSGLIRQGTLSPVDLVRACLERIMALNPSLNAFITVLPGEALAQAQVAEAEVKAGRWRGPLHGIPVGVKDFFDTAGVKTTAAFEHFRNRVPATDAPGVARLKDAGAIVIGKMNMHTLGMGTTGLESCFGPARNPWNRDYIPGGSSSGSAAAVASGMCFATLDTDAIGSCRLPASCCGVVGFKGTYGLISTRGILEGEGGADEMIRWLAHSGITTRSVSDTALVLDVLAEENGRGEGADFSRELAARRRLSLRIGVADNFTAEPEVVAAFEKAVETIGRLGFALTSVAVPFTDMSRGIQHIEQDRKAIAEQAFGAIDVLLLPTTTTTVPSVESAKGHAQALSPRNTLFANYYALPAISVPCGFDSNGLPLGLQMVGRSWDEHAILQLAEQYERATDRSRKQPLP